MCMHTFTRAAATWVGEAHAGVIVLRNQGRKKKTAQGILGTLLEDEEMLPSQIISLTGFHLFWVYSGPDEGPAHK